MRCFSVILGGKVEFFRIASSTHTPRAFVSIEHDASELIGHFSTISHQMLELF